MGNVKAKEKVRRHPPLSDAVRRFYEATETEIIIHAVRHQARKPFRDARRSLTHNSRQNAFFYRMITPEYRSYRQIYPAPPPSGSKSCGGDLKSYGLFGCHWVFTYPTLFT